VMGHRDTSGWHIDTQSSVKGGIKAGRDYNLLLAINGLNATLVVDNKDVFSHTYDARVEEGYSYALNWGLVGVGSNNARGSFDNIAVQVLPPQETIEVSDDFKGQASELGYESLVGDWTLSGQQYVATVEHDYAIQLASVRDVERLNGTAVMDLSATFSTDLRAGLVFDYYSETDFKWAALDVQNNEVLIGHYTARGGWVVDARVDRNLTAGKAYDLKIALRTSTVSVQVDGQTVLGHIYTGVVVDGRFGMLSVGTGTATQFDEMTFSSNDVVFEPVEQNLLARDVAVSTVQTVTALEAADLAPIVEEAISRWSLSEDKALIEAISDTQFVIADLDGQQLAAYQDGVIYIDIDAAGHGWFVDSSAGDDVEFLAESGVLLAADDQAQDRIDLLSVVMHELGHVMGLEHTDEGLMEDDLAVGVRTAPAVVAESTSSEAGEIAIGEETVDPQLLALLVETQTQQQLDAAQPSIDWTPVTYEDVRPGNKKPKASDPWFDDFLNHLAQDESQRNPNAALRVNLAEDQQSSRDLIGAMALDD
jgi:hypothetical protein